MKKNETKARRTRPPEVRTREQMEDHAFNQMLLWLGATVVVEVVMLLVNRYFIHARVEELGALPTLNTLLGIAPIAGVILFAAFVAWAVQLRKKDEGKDGVLQIVLGTAFLVMGLGGYVMKAFGSAAAPLVLGVVPALGVLMLVFYLYQKEFFACAVAGGLGILGLWVFRASASGSTYYAYLVVALVILAAGAVLAVTLKKKDGVMTIQGKEVALLQPGAVYAAYYLTAVVAAVLLVAPLALGAAVAYYSIWVMAAWLFILAVYFTSKLM